MITVPVELGDRSYPVLIGAGARHRLLEVLPVGARRAAVVTQERIPVIVDPGVEHRTFTIDDGEDAKNLETIEVLCRQFSQWGLTRSDVVVAVGGGVVTDAAGFAAAVYHRGVAVVHVATTLLAQVDAAIGGKTGVNLPDGKNLVGAFWQPAAVLCDTETLATLPPREYRSGLGEMAKYHFLGGDDLRDCNLDARVARCVAMKAAIVAADERESGRRATLNYGHTLGHALETAGEYDLRHGEAVAIGLVFAAELAFRLGRIPAERVVEHRRLLAAWELPTELPAGASRDGLMRLMARDKKATEGLTFVLDGPRGIEVVPGIPERDVAAVLERAGPMTEPVVLLLSGPNLNLLGSREPDVYGTAALDDHVSAATEAAHRHGIRLEHVQSNAEHALVEAVHGARHRCAAIVVNPGAFTHYAWSLHDALAAFEGPIIELHLSTRRDGSRGVTPSVIAPVATASISGLGGHGYVAAVSAVAELLGAQRPR